MKLTKYLKNQLFLVLAALTLQASALVLESEKFTKNNELITLTQKGKTFITDNKIGDKFRSSIRIIGKNEAKDWMKKFIQLSNDKAQRSDDFNDLNNFLNHIITCDQLLTALQGPPPPKVKRVVSANTKNGVSTGIESDEIPRKMKEDLIEHLKVLTQDLNDDINTLVVKSEQENFRKLILMYREALKVTLKLPVDLPL